MKKKLRLERNRKASGYESPGSPPAPDTKTKLSELLDFPAAALTGLCQMELSGNREAVINGCQGVLEYDENVIKLTTGKMALKFTGRGLQIKVLTQDSAIVTGFITNLEFIT